MSEKQETEVLIIGGGLAGLSVALQIKARRPETQITVLEKSTHPPPTAAHKVGESTVEIGASYFARVLGLKNYLEAHQLPKFGLRYFFPSSADSNDLADRVEVGGNRYLPSPSYQLDRGSFETYLTERAAEAGVRFADNCVVTNVDLNADGTHIVEANADGDRLSISTRWVIDASGRAEVLKRQLNLQEDPPHHGGSAVWFRVDTAVNIDDWSDADGWRDAHDQTGHTRRLSTNHLMGRGYWVWVIPLVSGTTSIGIVTDETIHSIKTYNSFDKALDWLRRHEPLCADKVAAMSDQVLDFKVITKFSRMASQVYSPDRWCLTGECGVFVDPFYSPGSDFIGISNTFVTDLVCRELDDESITQRCRIYDELYRSYSTNTFNVFDGQYEIFGNAAVMPLKILWDYAVYWTFLAQVFCQDRLCDLTSFIHTRGQFDEIGELNAAMQPFFNAWHQHQVEDHQPAPAMLDQTTLPFIVDLNRGLTEELDTDAYVAKMTENLQLLRELAAELADTAKQRHPGLDVSQLPPPDPAAPRRLTAALKTLQMA
jgi:2-polyprenyl-6-methoxyphenol hydroxylase-like FAD-dependent oxidoreductase